MKKMTRRKFMDLSVVSISALFLSPIVGFFFPKKLEEVPSVPQPVGTPEELPVGASKTIPFGRYPALVINTEDGLKAYSAVCTHFACLVKWDEENGEIACPCHEGYFNVGDGSVKSGPPPRGLDVFHAYINDEDGVIYVEAEES